MADAAPLETDVVDGPRRGAAREEIRAIVAFGFAIESGWIPPDGLDARKDTSVRELRSDHSFIKPVSEKGRAIVDRYRSGWLARYRENWRILELPDAAGF